MKMSRADTAGACCSSVDVELFDHLRARREAEGHSSKSARKYASYMSDLGRGRAIASKLCGPGCRDVLDVGCGYGCLLSAFSEMGANAHGIDIDPERVEWTSRRLNAGDIRHCSATDLPWEDSTFDLVTSTDVLEHLPFGDQVKAVLEMVRVTRPGGIVYIEVPNRFQLLDEHNRIPLGTWMPPRLRKFVSRMMTGHFVQCWERSMSGWRSLTMLHCVKVAVSKRFPRNQDWLRLLFFPPNRFQIQIRKEAENGMGRD